MALGEVRIVTGVPTAANFASAIGSPLVVNDATGIVYFLNGSTVTPIIGSGAVSTVSGTAPIASSGGTTPAISLTDAGVTYAKIQNISATNTILGRKTAGAGSAEEITVAGDLTQSGSTFTIGNNLVTNGKLAQMATLTVKGNNTGGTANAIDLTVTQTQTLLSIPPQTTGSWTPADNSGASLAFGSVSANYTRIGNMVFAYATWAYPVTASGSSASISGLPVSVANVNYAQVPSPADTTASITGGLVVVPVKNTTTANFDIGSPFGPVTNLQLSAATVSIMLIYPAT